MYKYETSRIRVGRNWESEPLSWKMIWEVVEGGFFNDWGRWGGCIFFYSKTTRENYLVGEGANIFGLDPLSQKMMGRREGL